jgi:hypothetical protein
MAYSQVTTGAFVLALAVGVAGCSAGGGGVIPDAHTVDAYEVSLDLPVGCPPPVGNDKGVGKPCTRGGHECTGGSGTYVCTCDDFLTIKLDGVPCICTVVTLNNGGNPDAGDLCASQSPDICGTGATCCAYMSVGTYCAPDICLPGGTCPEVVTGP